MNLQNEAVIFLGDSITQGAMATEPKNVYHQVFGKITGCEVFADGIGGTRIAKQNKPSADANFDKDFVSRAKNLPNGDFVFVFGGTNDFGHGDAPLGNFSDKTSSTFCGACNVLLGYLGSRYGAQNIAVILPLHRWDENSVHGDGSKKPLSLPLVNYVDALRKIAQNSDIRVVDFWEDKQLNPNLADNYENYFYDGLHPNDAGHKLLAEKLAKAVELM